ncbi:ABC transporter permease [Paenibacillus pinihumi]|uniref:ABC transporter permease n=1 Tax=Paenibacillus pinihumi TaxID=669462 RepID=UPI00041FF27C|nr:ABC transporter permease [Paenibacillus pinihumi]
MRRLLASEFLKLRRKMIWFLIVLGPAGVIALQAVNYGLRFDYLMKNYAGDPWGYLIKNVSMLLIPALLMGMTIISSMIATLEHHTNAWKQTIALPVSRTKLYLGKFAVTTMLLLVSTVLVLAGTVALGLIFGFELQALPWDTLLIALYGAFIGALPYLAVQIWLAVTLNNQAIPLTVGISGLVLSMLMINGSSSKNWLPWKWPYLALLEPVFPVAAGLAASAVLYLLGSLHFARKDVG